MSQIVMQIGVSVLSMQIDTLARKIPLQINALQDRRLGQPDPFPAN